MKLVFINDRIYKYASADPSAVGGAERQQWLLARALARTNWQVVVGVSEGITDGNRKTIEGVEFRDIGLAHGHIFSNWYKFLATERPDWWYWRLASHLLGPAFYMANYLKVRTIFAAGLDSDVNPRRALFWRSQFWPLYALGLRISDRILVQHEGQWAELPNSLRAKAFLIPSIAGEEIDLVPQTAKKSYVAWVGQIRLAKRSDLLIELARKLEKIPFVVCGGISTFGSTVEYGEEIIAQLRALPNVDYKGQVTPDIARQTIANAGLFLSTSDEEGFPNTFLQAWSVGTPVVSLKIDPDAVFARKKVGLVCRGVDDAAEKITLLLDSLEMREEIANLGRIHVARRHSESAVLKKFDLALQGTRS